MKGYLALVKGVPSAREGKIDTGLAHVIHRVVAVQRTGGTRTENADFSAREPIAKATGAREGHAVAPHLAHGGSTNSRGWMDLRFPQKS